MRRALAIVVVCVSCAAAAHAACYALPFANPNVRYGWGATGKLHHGYHRGVDFPEPRGTPIPAVADGVVVVRARSRCLGNVVVVAHEDGVYSGYAHMAAPSPLAVGSRVARGQIVGFVGSTGTCATGPHLHLTIAPTRDGWLRGTTYDPLAYILARRRCAPRLNEAP